MFDNHQRQTSAAGPPAADLFFLYLKSTAMKLECLLTHQHPWTGFVLWEEGTYSNPATHEVHSTQSGMQSEQFPWRNQKLHVETR